MATLPAGSDVVVMVTNPSMAMLNGARDSGGRRALRISHLDGERRGPRVVGVPEIVAVLSAFVVSVSPAGKEPLLTLHV